MEKIIYVFLILIFVRCDTKTSAPKSEADKPVGSCIIKYPLPKTSDSLLLLLQKLPDDTNRVQVLNALGWKMMYANTDSAILLSSQALAIADNLILSSDSLISRTGKKCKSNSFGQLGVYNYVNANYNQALEFNLKALTIDNEIGNTKGIASRYANIANVYVSLGDYPKALDNYFAALRSFEKLGDKNRIAIQLGNIGVVYKEMKQYDKSLAYYFKALKLREDLGAQDLVASTLCNIGNAYKDFAAMPQNRKDAKAKDTLYDLALNYLNRALKMDEESADQNGIAADLANMGSVYSEQKDFRNAFKAIYRGLAISDSLDASNDVKEDFLLLSTLYEQSSISLPDTIGGKLLNPEQMRLRSLHYFKSYIDLRDTLFSEENKKQLVRKEMNFGFEKKEAATKAENDKKEALAKEELKQKEMERNYFIAGFSLVILLAGFIFRGYRQKQKANQIISMQKDIVEEKQKEILDSIQYAKRIQQSLLPTEKYIGKNLKRLND